MNTEVKNAEKPTEPSPAEKAAEQALAAYNTADSAFKAAERKCVEQKAVVDSVAKRESSQAMRVKNAKLSLDQKLYEAHSYNSLTTKALRKIHRDLRKSVRKHEARHVRMLTTVAAELEVQKRLVELKDASRTEFLNADKALRLADEAVKAG